MATPTFSVFKRMAASANQTPESTATSEPFRPFAQRTQETKNIAERKFRTMFGKFIPVDPETQTTESIPESKPVLEPTEEEKRNTAQRTKNTAFAAGRPATLFSQPESSNIKIKKPTLGSGS